MITRLEIAAQILATQLAKIPSTAFDKDQLAFTCRNALRAADILIQVSSGVENAPAPAAQATQDSSEAPAQAQTAPAESGSILEEVTAKKPRK